VGTENKTCCSNGIFFDFHGKNTYFSKENRINGTDGSEF
jgi:hypothetical protein